MREALFTLSVNVRSERLSPVYFQWVKKVAKMSKERGSQPTQGTYGMKSICCGIMMTCYLSMWLMALALMKDRASILEDGEHD
ncbi:hypothetical protein AERO9A_210212 [Aeromonas salmonicida]|nr:hypothetical protein AERO9A_210212 [Aeromonas salmonicida]